MPTLRSIPGVAELVTLYGRDADDRAPALLIEVPHGATRAVEFQAVHRALVGPFPEGLLDFFFVNTDAGAPELALAVARHVLDQRPDLAVCVLRAQVPRTFIDVNRVLDASPEAYREGGVTPGLPPYVRAPEDQRVLLDLHARYTELARELVDEACGGGGAALLLHTYAPRSLDVEVDDDIVRSLHRGYAPGVYETWPGRPPFDLIARGLDGADLAPAGLREALEAALAPLEVADSATYPMHPSTQAFHHVARHPGRVACVEVRRDLLADPFEPFAEMRISPAHADRLGAALARALTVILPVPAHDRR